MTPQAVASIELTSVPPPPAGDPEYQPPDPAPPPFPDPTEPRPTPTEPELPPLQPPPERDRPSATQRKPDLSGDATVHHTKPTDEGVRRWPPDGYLQLNCAIDVRRQVACTCTERCDECHGDCGCEACQLGWLVYQDDQALWDEEGNLVNVVELGAAWKRLADPRQLRLRFQGMNTESSRGSGEAGEATHSDDGRDQPTPPDPTPDDHPSVPPIYHEDSASWPDPGKAQLRR